jgi:serine/threonine protein phosphatase PrpC
MFNFPFQLGSESSDLPKHADITKTKAQIGDLIIAATDGFFDNMFDDHITEVLKQQLNGGSVKDLQGPHLAELAQALSEAAFKQGQSKSAVTPFSAHARQSGYRYQGGKPDDITVLVATVRTEEQAKQSEALRIARPKL